MIALSEILTHTPKKAEDIARLAKRTSAATETIKLGYTYWTDETGVAVCKPGTLAAEYWITENGCSCPDFAHHGDFCKHTVAAAYVQTYNLPQTASTDGFNREAYDILHTEIVMERMCREEEERVKREW